MRRVLIALIALALCVGVAYPRAIVLFSNRSLPVNSDPINKGQESDRQTFAAVCAALNRWNPGGYDIGDAKKARTDDIRTGLFNGTQYSEVILVALGYLPGANPGGWANTTTQACNVCSLSVSVDGGGKMPTVPMLWIAPPTGESPFAATTSTCSLAVNNEAYDPDFQGPGYASTRFRLEGTSYVWPPATGIATPVWSRNQVGGTPDSSYTPLAAPSGGFRTIIGAHPSAYYGYTYSQAAGVDRDSIINPKAWVDAAYPTTGYRYVTYFPTPDSAYGPLLWMNYNDSRAYTRWGTSPFAPSMYCQTGSVNGLDVGGGISAGTSTATDRRVAFAPEMVMAALAAFDSLCGKDVLGTNLGGQIRLAVQIDGAFSRGDQYSAGGVSPHDSSTVKASVDSLGALGIPFGVIVSLDSLNVYASDKAWWTRSSNAYFEASRYVSNSAPTSYGLLRQQLAAAYASMDSAFGRNRVDRVYCGADTDDWTPSDITGQSAAKWDSLMWAMSSVGITGVANDAEADSEGTFRGWPGPQQSFPVTLIGGGRTLLKLNFPGFDRRGALEQHGKVSITDGHNTIATAKANIVQDSCFTAHYVQRSVYGALMGYWLPNYDAARVFNNGSVMTKGWYGEPALTGQVSKKANTNTGCNLVRITASSLGAGQHGSQSPARPGFYQVKYLVNIAKAINQLAGRQLIVFVRPDQLGAADIRR